MGELATKIRTKFPGAYDSLADDELESKVMAKFPGVYDHLASKPSSRVIRQDASYTEDPAKIERARREFVSKTAKPQTQLKELVTNSPREFLTGETRPPTGPVDFATRVVPESVGKLVPRTLSALYDQGKAALTPYADAIDNIRQGYPVLDSLAKGVKESYGSQVEGLKGLANFARERTGLQGLDKAKEGFLSDPAGTAALVAPLAKPMARGVGKLSDLTKSLPHEVKLSTEITKGIDKGIRPGVEGNRTFAQSENYAKKANTAVKTILENKDKLNITDEFGELTGKLPQNLKQFSQAIDQTKGEIFKTYNDMAVKSGQRGAEVDLSPLSGELESIANNRVLMDSAPDVAAYAKKRAEAYKNANQGTDGISTSSKKTYTAEQAQNAITIFNQTLDAFYKNPSYETASKAYVDSLIVNHLRKGLDTAIENISGPGYQDLKNRYGSLKSIEKDVARRAIVDARKNNKGLLDFSDVFSGSEVVRGILTMSPATVGTGVAAKMIANLYKLKNDPNRIVKNMFEKADKLYTRQGLPQSMELPPITPAPPPISRERVPVRTPPQPPPYSKERVPVRTQPGPEMVYDPLIGRMIPKAPVLGERTPMHTPLPEPPPAPKIEVQIPLPTWKEFVKGKMGTYMKSEGSHGAAMKKLSEEFKTLKEKGKK